MAQGDGSIREIKKPDSKSYSPKRWQVCVSFGIDPVTGKHMRAQRNVQGTKSDAFKARNQLKAEHENGLTMDGAQMTFALFSKQWHDARVAAGEVGQTRLKREESIINDFNAHIDTIRLHDLTPQSIEQVYTLLREEKLEKSGSAPVPR